MGLNTFFCKYKVMFYGNYGTESTVKMRSAHPIGIVEDICRVEWTRD